MFRKAAMIAKKLRYGAAGNKFQKKKTAFPFSLLLLAIIVVELVALAVSWLGYWLVLDVATTVCSSFCSCFLVSCMSQSVRRWHWFGLQFSR